MVVADKLSKKTPFLHRAQTKKNNSETISWLDRMKRQISDDGPSFGVSVEELIMIAHVKLRASQTGREVFPDRLKLLVSHRRVRRSSEASAHLVRTIFSRTICSSERRLPCLLRTRGDLAADDAIANIQTTFCDTRRNTVIWPVHRQRYFAGSLHPLA